MLNENEMKEGNNMEEKDEQEETKEEEVKSEENTEKKSESEDKKEPETEEVKEPTLEDKYKELEEKYNALYKKKTDKDREIRHSESYKKYDLSQENMGLSRNLCNLVSLQLKFIQKTQFLGKSLKFHAFDEYFFQNRDKDRYKVAKKCNRSIIFEFGKMIFNQRVYWDKLKKEYYYPVYEEFNIQKRAKIISWLKEEIISYIGRKKHYQDIQDILKFTYVSKVTISKIHKNAKVQNWDFPKNCVFWINFSCKLTKLHRFLESPEKI